MGVNEMHDTLIGGPEYLKKQRPGVHATTLSRVLCLD
jgi:hypothetical protein